MKFNFNKGSSDSFGHAVETIMDKHQLELSAQSVNPKSQTESREAGDSVPKIPKDVNATKIDSGRDNSPEGIIRRQKFAIELLTGENSNMQSDMGKLRVRIAVMERAQYAHTALADGYAHASMLIAAVSIVIWGVLGGSGALVASQVSPETPLQAIASSVATKFSNEPTAFNRIKEAGYSVKALQVEKQNNEIFKKVLATQEEITVVQQKLLKSFSNQLAKVDPMGYRSVQASVDLLPKLSPSISIDNPKTNTLAPAEMPFRKAPKVPLANADTQPAVSQEAAKESITDKIAPSVIAKAPEKLEKKVTGKETERTYQTVSKLRAAILPEFAESDVKIRIQERSDGRILVWTVVGWRNSAAFFAGTSKHRMRLTEEGMRQWVKDSIGQVSLVSKIESVAKVRDLRSFNDGNVSMKIKKMGTGDVDVTFADAFSGKVNRFRLWKWTSDELEIGAKMDASLASLVD